MHVYRGVVVSLELECKH